MSQWLTEFVNDLNDCLTGWMTDCVTERLPKRISDWLPDWINDWLNDLMTSWVSDWLTEWLSDCVTDCQAASNYRLYKVKHCPGKYKAEDGTTFDNDIKAPFHPTPPPSPAPTSDLRLNRPCPDHKCCSLFYNFCRGQFVWDGRSWGRWYCLWYFSPAIILRSVWHALSSAILLPLPKYPGQKLHAAFPFRNISGFYWFLSFVIFLAFVVNF